MVFALLVGIGMLLVSLLSYGMATSLIVHLVVRLIQKGYSGLGFWKNVAVTTSVSLVTALVHLIQMAQWAVAILMCRETSSFENAFYCSAQNYTALGYGDFVLSERWRLLGPLEAVNGLLLFGLSTAVMFAVMSRLISTRLRLHLSLPQAGGSGAMSDLVRQRSLNSSRAMSDHENRVADHESAIPQTTTFTEAEHELRQAVPG
jgi:hypothetical protein